MTITIGAPGAPDGFDKTKALGHILIGLNITREETTTQFGPATIARVGYLCDFDTDQVWTNTEVYGKLLAPAFFNSGQQLVAGRLVQGEASKEGQSPPWMLEELSAADVELVQAWCDQFVSQLKSGLFDLDVAGITGQASE